VNGDVRRIQSFHGVVRLFRDAFVGNKKRRSMIVWLTFVRSCFVQRSSFFFFFSP
jgi:hypothetical protein